MPVDESIGCLEKYSNTVLNGLALSVLEGKGGKFQLKPEYHQLKLTNLQFTAMSPTQRAEHWRKLALDPPEESAPEGFVEIQLRIPGASSTEVSDLLTFAEILNCDTDALRQSTRSPNVFMVRFALFCTFYNVCACLFFTTFIHRHSMTAI